MSVVVITGCNSGFGLEIAAGFAKRGDQVVATVRDLDRAGALRDRVPDAAVRTLEVTDPESRGPLVEGVLSEFGQIDVLVNNAGITQFGPAKRSTLSTIA